MARPTNDPKETKVMLRVNEETRRYVLQRSKEQGLSVSQYIRNAIDAEKISNSKDFVSQNTVNMQFSRNVSNDIIADFDTILNLYDTDFERFFKALYRKVESGEIDVEEVMK